MLGIAALVAGVAALAAVAGAFAVSRCGGGGEAQVGRLALQLDAESDRGRIAQPAPRPARRAASPVRVVIPAIGVRAPVVRLGLNPDHTLEVPTNFGDTGWWTGGARPGEPGPAIIAGHVDSHTGPAVFYRIRELRAGDAVIVERRDGSRARFVVQGSEQYPKARFPTARVYGRTAGPTLRLITCAGTFDRSSGHYLDNTVVYARAAV
jgi:sortase (surface protein transpeptidase)